MDAERIRPQQILSLLHEQGFRCAYTGDPLTPENVGADHKTPVTRGGGHGLDNIALVLASVNAAKGAMTLDEFVDMCRKVAKRFGDGNPDDPVEANRGTLSGDSDPVAVLTMLGYLDAAEEVRSLKVKIDSLRRSVRPHGGRPLGFGEYTESQRATIAKLNQEIQVLRVTRSKLRRETGFSAVSGSPSEN